MAPAQRAPGPYICLSDLTLYFSSIMLKTGASSLDKFGNGFMQNGLNQNIPDLKYNFHDALLMGFQIGPRRELILNISLYEIYYKGSPLVDVRFGAITNFESVRSFFEKFEEPDEGYARIDALRYDKRQESTAGKLFFYLELDWYGEVKIHCGKFTVNDSG